MKPELIPALAGLRINPESAHEIPRRSSDEPPVLALSSGRRGPAAWVYHWASVPGLGRARARSLSRGSAPTPSDHSASPPMPMQTLARTSALGGYVTGHGNVELTLRLQI